MHTLEAHVPPTNFIMPNHDFLLWMLSRKNRLDDRGITASQNVNNWKVNKAEHT